MFEEYWIVIISKKTFARILKVQMWSTFMFETD